jgi:hypothetical protein
METTVEQMENTANMATKKTPRKKTTPKTRTAIKETP